MFKTLEQLSTQIVALEPKLIPPKVRGDSVGSPELVQVLFLLQVYRASLLYLSVRGSPGLG